ncbi:FAD-binding domain-containing protein [Nevskia sp.]|uniref:FAD-binding domain-containing protein n=1 Tax=Nevskia sp. TaxID=1929292 RepID=UPI0025FBF084|nr:FAD-binding domain-containing protein [Nevskia sp.]
MSHFIATRRAALAQLDAFLPRAAAHYASERNTDGGTEARDNVSLLSPAVRHRLIGEDEIVRAVLDRHAFSSAEKFIQEVCWRSYWKGWLELRPQVWADYQAALRALTPDDGCRAAVEGRSGIACFDAWVAELLTTGYLHNHARMWFASIWIFTLKLPWQLGADFFYRHLLDGDPAANTLSWRWVAGLQTRGKHYLARADNIQQYTAGRFWPKGELNENAAPLPPDDIPAAGRILELPLPKAGLRTALWLHEDDLSAESWPLPEGIDVVAIGGDVDPASRSRLPVSAAVIDWTTSALADGLDRAASHFGVAAHRITAGDLQRWCDDHGIEQIVTAYATVGPVADALAKRERELAARGIVLVRVRRAWDTAFWPHAGKGFFQLREKIRPLLGELGIP